MNSNVLKNRLTKRTTVTLEADVADFIEKKLAQNKGLKEKQLINKLLRSGIKNETNQPAPRFKIEGFKSEIISTSAGSEAAAAGEIERMLDEI
jgi:hypothetical protein